MNADDLLTLAALGGILSGLMRRLWAAPLLFLAACSNNAAAGRPLRRDVEPARLSPPLANSQRLPMETNPLSSEIQRELVIWGRTVLEYADNATLLRLKQDTMDVMRMLDARYREAGEHEPYTMVDYRHSLAERIQVESERLRMIEAKIGSK
jgi:hypothetical protein